MAEKIDYREMYPVEYFHAKLWEVVSDSNAKAWRALEGVRAEERSRRLASDPWGSFDSLVRIRE